MVESKKSNESNKSNHDIVFRFIPIDGEYGICGSTYLSTLSSGLLSVNTSRVLIDIDSTENFGIEGLFRTIVLHELGHCFGLTHSVDKNSIMHPFITSFDKTIGIDDIKNIFITQAKL